MKTCNGRTHNYMPLRLVQRGFRTGQSLIGASLPCEDPDANNSMDNLIFPFTNETCVTTSQICDCMNEAILSGSVSGSESGSELFSGEYDEVNGIHSLDYSKSLNILPCIIASVNIHCRDSTCQISRNPPTKSHLTRRESLRGYRTTLAWLHRLILLISMELA